MKLLLTFSHLYSGVLFGSCVFLGIAAHFDSKWAQFFLTFKDRVLKLTYLWIPVLALTLVFTRELIPYHEFKNHKALYFTTWFLVLRQVLYALGMLLLLKVLKKLPSLSLILVFVIANLFAFDWGVPLDGEWFSNMYGLIFIATGASAALSLMLLRDDSKEVRIDLVHFLLVTCLVTLYFHFSQFIIFWMGNLPREVVFYTRRFEKFGELYLGLTLLLRVLPIGLLSLVPKLKTDDRALRMTCVLIVLSYLLEIIWTVYV